MAHNVQNNVSRLKEVGTSMLLFGPLIQQLDFEKSGKDDTWLGRWCFMAFHGSEGIKTRMVCGYNPCYNKKKESNTSYQQTVYSSLPNKNIGRAQGSASKNTFWCS